MERPKLFGWMGQEPGGGDQWNQSFFDLTIFAFEDFENVLQKTMALIRAPTAWRNRVLRRVFNVLVEKENKADRHVRSEDQDA